MESTIIDMYRHISLEIGALKLFGIWFYIPYRMKNVRFWICIFAKIILGIVVFVIPTGSQLVYVVRLIMSGKAEIQEVASIINLVLTESLASVRLLDLCLRRDLLLQLSGQLMSHEFQCTSEPEKIILEKAITVSRRLFWIFLSTSGLDILVHVVVAPGLHNFETLPLKMDLIFLDVNKESYFNYVFAYQILYKPMMLTTFVALQTLPWGAMSCSMHIATVVFACPWIELPTSMKKNLVLFITNTQRPLVITAVKLVPVSLETFTKVMNWTYKGFAIMNQMKK